MANKLYEEASVQAIAEAIRAKNGSTDTYKIGDMADAINSIEEAESESIEWHQCPELPRQFVEEVTYDPSDYTTSQIENYAPDAPVVSNYKPIGKTVGDKTFYNEIPNVATPFNTGKRFGTVKPLDKVRYINTQNAANVRDLGGWICDGGTVKYGLLFRGGEPTANDRAVLVDELGIRHDLNLRGSTEATWNTSPLGEDIHFTKADAFNWYSISNIEAWKINLRCVFDAVTHNEPVYFHCAAGADRTGTLACILEGVLGLSQSDIDKDYELTSFYMGTEDDLHSRRRNETDWTNLINAINAKQGDSFRDRCIRFVAECGFTADEINAYRAAMIDGTPETITLNTTDCTVTNTLSGSVTNSNPATTVKQYQPYEAKLSVPLGYIIGDVKITMNGADVTNAVFKGEKENLKRKVAKTAENCIVESRKTVIDGQDFTAMVTPNKGYVLSNIAITMDGVDITEAAFYGKETVLKRIVTTSAENCVINCEKTAIDGKKFTAMIIPNAGYTMSGGTVTIIMGGVDMSNYYSNGVISIPNVNGNIEITATAVEQTVTYTNQIPLSTERGSTDIYNGGLGYKQNTRLNSSLNVVDTDTGYTYELFTTGVIPISDGDVLRFKNCWMDPDGTPSNGYPMSYGSCNIAIVNTNGEVLNTSAWDKLSAIHLAETQDDDGNIREVAFNYTGASDYAGVQFTLAGNGEDAVITINEEIE